MKSYKNTWGILVIPSESSVIGKPNLIDLHDIIATVFDIILKAWKSIETKGSIGRADSELEIAGKLGSAMLLEKNRRKALKDQIRIEEEVGTRRSVKASKPEGRIDIKIIYSFNEEEYFGIECKRVGAVRSGLANKYIKHGVMRFVTGKYCPGHRWAAMLGFVVHGSSSDCAALIRSRVESARKTTRMIGNWTADSTFGIASDLYRTQHRQTEKGSRIAILHLFLLMP